MKLKGTNSSRKSIAVPDEIKTRVTERVHWCISKATQQFDRTFDMPRVTYNLSGTVAGRAHYKMWEIRLNTVLLMENVEEFIHQVVPHEVAHLIDRHINGVVRTGYKREIHGTGWQNVMYCFGLKPDRCHNFDTTNARTRPKVRYIYTCSRCGRQVRAGPRQHQNIQSMEIGSYVHKRCGASLRGCQFERKEY